jgi:hypothetical protein
MIEVVIASQLRRFFPMLKDQPLRVEAKTAAEAILAVNAFAPNFSDYVLDERGALRRHVAVFIGEEMVIDRQSLADPIPDGGTLFVLQALSGG